MRLSIYSLIFIASCFVITPGFAGYLFVNGGPSGQVNRYDSTTGVYVDTFRVPGGIGFSAGLAVFNGRVFLAGQDDGAIFRFDATRR